MGRTIPSNWLHSALSPADFSPLNRKLETVEYYREHAKLLRELADTVTETETAIVLRHVASNYDVIADLIEMLDGAKPNRREGGPNGAPIR